MKYRVPRFWPLFGVGTLFLALFILYWTSGGQAEKYRQVVKDVESSSSIQPQRSSKQQRSGVKKDISSKQKGERLQISSKQSELLFENGAVVEKMEGVSCILQDASQSETAIQSEKAYFDGRKMVLSDGVSLEHIWGKLSAEHATLTPSDKNSFLMFDEAELRGEVKIEIHNSGTIQADHVTLNLKQYTAFFEGNQVHYTDGVNQVFADKVTVDRGKVFLDGNVKVSSHEGILLQYVLADSLEYTPKTKTALFRSNQGKRVIFFDQPNNIQMTAPELKVVRGEKESIEGIGDVRFEFLEDELKELKKLFMLGEG